MIPPSTIIPDYLYAGQAFQELGSLAYNMPNYPALAFNLASMPGSRDVTNAAAGSVMAMNITPDQE
jgi:hypothetical protein